ncbi:hypothetical protein ACFLVC_05215 [Chloroflexota bacterium]
MGQVEGTKQISPQIEHVATQRAADKAKAARWDLNIAIFLFSILILIIILTTYTKMGFEAMALVALFGLAMVWLEGWRREKQLFKRFYDEELANLNQDSKQTLKDAVRETVEETIEEQVQKAFRERWR